MRGKLVAAGAAVLMVLGVSAAFATPNPGPGGSNEGSTVCDENGENCQDVYDNEVECGTGNVADEGSLSVSMNQAGSGGYLEVCNDGDTAPVQGRIIGQGDAEAQEGQLCADGDASNPDGNAEGWACLQGDGEGNPTVVCGDPEGNLDSQNQGATDGTEHCG